tara:strand:+ start:2291 stop:2926 length:636 start_codon:yes stop_codon:yes gene_type:complete
MRQNRNRLSDVLRCGQVHLARTGMQPGSPLGPYPNNFGDWVTAFQALNGRGPALNDMMEWWQRVHPRVRGQCEAHVANHPTWYEKFDVHYLWETAETVAKLLDDGQDPDHWQVRGLIEQMIAMQLALIQPGMRVMNLETCRRGTVFEVNPQGRYWETGRALVEPRVTYDDAPENRGDWVSTEFFSPTTRGCNFVKVLDAAGPLPAFLPEVD